MHVCLDSRAAPVKGASGGVNTVRLALAQINPILGHLSENVGKILDRINEAKRRAVHIVVFPELAICGYPPEDLLLKPAFLQACRASLEQIVPATSGLLVIVGFPEVDDDLYNAAAVLCDGKLAGVYRKQYLPSYSVFDEDRYFCPSTRTPVFVADGKRVGVSICEDMWYPNGPHETQAVLGNTQLLINISASPYYKGKAMVRERMLAVRAADCQATLAFCNLVGGQDELVFDGGSAIFDPHGNIIARARRFREDFLIQDIDLSEVQRQRLRDTRRRKEKTRGESVRRAVEEVSVPIRFQSSLEPIGTPHLVEPLSELAEVYEALVLGTRDYLRKNGFEKAVLGLSGGIDSSLVACIAADAIGPEHVVGVSMPSRYSSDHSLVDASQLAQALGLRHLTISIEPAFEAFHRMLAEVFSGTVPDLTEENLQSRIRGVLLMALSNKFGWLVLTTGNKSEMSTGYATLYGDMAGGFAVIKDVPKTLVYELSRYRNSRKPVIPERVFLKPPSAELRVDQKDSDSLPEYSELDAILAAYVEEDRSVAEMIANGFDAATVNRVVALVDRAEYKRRQAPPGVKITPRAFGKDRRLPMTNRFLEVGL